MAMEGDTEPTFKSLQDEAAFYREQAVQYEAKWREAQLELEEFQASSRDLEAELETQLKQYEASNRELRAMITRLQVDNEGLQEKLQQSKQEGARQVHDLQAQLEEVTASREEMHSYIRELEQSNDDLERAKRATVASLEEFESKLNQAIERNAFLESELDEKEAMSFMVQRLKDEARDLKQELMIQQSVHKEQTTPFVPDAPSPLVQRRESMGCAPLIPPRAQASSCIPGIADSNRLATDGAARAAAASNGAPQQPPPGVCSSGQTPLTPSARVSALNIVGDLLRKVGTLESKLASCRNFVKSPQKEETDGGTAGLVTAMGRAHLKQRALSSPQEFVPLAF
ncbi:nuclear distribution protein nudE-like 1 isoform X3 [Dermacentor variabilis]|uniref:nuclear distribution protein nudE-like 1 isoform X3 n=1 Tax=Dermacentor variabilis TaxID=34621 RepID=UPI003F5B1A24